MNPSQLELAAKLVGTSYARQAGEAGMGQQSRTSQLLEQGKMPQDGWQDREIEFLLQQLSQMDSNNFPANAGVGEREGRVYSSLVARRHYGLGHGIGRSGDLTEVQPKAAGSSIRAAWLDKCTGFWKPICETTYDEAANVVAGDIPTEVFAESCFNPKSGCTTAIVQAQQCEGRQF